MSHQLSVRRPRTYLPPQTSIAEDLGPPRALPTRRTPSISLARLGTRVARAMAPHKRADEEATPVTRSRGIVRRAVRPRVLGAEEDTFGEGAHTSDGQSAFSRPDFAENCDVDHDGDSDDAATLVDIYSDPDSYADVNMGGWVWPKPMAGVAEETDGAGEDGEADDHVAAASDPEDSPLMRSMDSDHDDTPLCDPADYEELPGADEDIIFDEHDRHPLVPRQRKLSVLEPPPEPEESEESEPAKEQSLPLLPLPLPVQRTPSSMQRKILQQIPESPLRQLFIRRNSSAEDTQKNPEIGEDEYTQHGFDAEYPYVIENEPRALVYFTALPPPPRFRRAGAAASGAKGD